MDKDYSKEILLVIFTAVVGVASVWVSLTLFPREPATTEVPQPTETKKQESRESPSSPPGTGEEPTEVKGLRQQLAEQAKELESLRASLEKLKREVPQSTETMKQSPESPSSPPDTREESSEMKALRQQLAEQGNDLESLRASLKKQKKEVVMPEPSTPSKGLSTSEVIETTVQKAHEFLKDDTEKSWTEEQETVLAELNEHYSIKGLTDEQNAALRDSIQKMNRRKN